MKLVTFEVPEPTGAVERVGVVNSDGAFVDVTTGYATKLEAEGHPTPDSRAQSIAPPDMVTFLEQGTEAMEAAKAVKDMTAERGYGDRQLIFNPDSVTLKSPLPRPRKIRDFSVFEDHGGEKSDDWYEIPAYYNGNPDAVVDPDTTIEWPPYTDLMDYELEVGAVIGKKGRNIDSANAMEYIAGFTIFNDFSARDIQRRQGLSPGKGKDFANGFGPYLVTTDEFTPNEGDMIARINGEEWSRGNLRDMYHSWEDLVEYASWGETIYPGDILGSGTVGGGCGSDLGQYIDSGDEIELEVEGLGVLTHRTEK